MLKKHSTKKSKNNINLINGRNTYTDYNKNHLKLNKNSIKEKINATNDNNNNNNIRIIHSLFESPLIKTSSNIDSNYPLGLSYQTQANTQPLIYSSPKLNCTNSTDFSHFNLKNSKEILKKLRKTILKIKLKKRLNNLNEQSPNNLIINKNNFYKNNIIRKHNLKNIDYIKNFSKTTKGFGIKKNKIKLEENEKDKNKYKELRFKVHNTIKSNSHPLCNNFINKAHLFNEKILEYYQSDHYINLIKNFQNNFHYKLNLETNPKIKMYTDIKSLEKTSKTNKLDFKKCFSQKEQKLILLDPAYYFQKDNPDNFINVNIVKKKSLADRIREEDEEKQIKKMLNNYLNKKNKQRTRNSLTQYEYTENKNEEKKKEKILMSKVSRILSYNKIKNLNSKKIKNLELTNLSTSKSNKNENILKNDDNYDFFKSYKTYVKDSYALALQLNKIEKEKKSKKRKFIFKVDNKLRNCVIELHSISKDKALQKRAKDNLYYDKAKDEKNKFNIITRQMLVEQNYEYLSKFGRKIIVSNENEKNNVNNNKETKKELEEDEKNYSNNKENDITDNKEKKVINTYINKIKLVYKQQ